MVHKKEPYIDFYTGDWLKDQAVSRCTPATRGVWIDLLCAMHDDGRSGKLCGTLEELSRLARCSAAELSTALTSLQTTGAADVTERHGIFTVINRRMYRKAQDREADRLRQQRSRASKAAGSECHDVVTPPSQAGPIDSDIDTDLSSFFSGDLPSILDVSSFRERLGQWLIYKRERRESYKTQGLASMISRAAKLAAMHGISAVEDAIETAMANRWAGWDQPNSFGGQKNGKHDRYADGAGQRYRGPAGPG